MIRSAALRDTGLIEPFGSADKATLVELALRGDWAEVPRPHYRRRVHGASSLEAITADMSEVAEGIRTTRAVCALADRERVEMPIAQGMRRVLDGELPPSAALEYVMSRQLRNENE